MRLSVITCVYNTDKAYLDTALSSIYSSTLSDFEVVFVDDGSTVDYSDITAKYPVKYVKIENRGHLGARLHGISLAKGDYVTFVDSDDSVSNNYHAPMVATALASNADIVINGWAFHTGRTRRVCYQDTTMSRKIDVTNAALDLFTSQGGREHSYYVFWNKIYKRELILRAIDELKATEICSKKITFAEDALINFFCFKNAKIIKNVNSGFYFYRIHASQTVTVTDENKLHNQIECMTSVLNTMLSSVGEWEMRGNVISGILEWNAMMSRTHYAAAKAGGHTHLFDFIKESYGVAQLEPPRISDGEAYSTTELLGDNFDEIDLTLSELCRINRPITVNYEKTSICISRIIDYLSQTYGNITYAKQAEFYIPRRKIKLRDRIIHNPTISRIGARLFKKGSRLRAFLKKHL